MRSVLGGVGDRRESFEWDEGRMSWERWGVMGEEFGFGGAGRFAMVDTCVLDIHIYIEVINLVSSGGALSANGLYRPLLLSHGSWPKECFWVLNANVVALRVFATRFPGFVRRSHLPVTGVP